MTPFRLSPKSIEPAEAYPPLPHHPQSLHQRQHHSRPATQVNYHGSLAKPRNSKLRPLRHHPPTPNPTQTQSALPTPKGPQ